MPHSHFVISDRILFIYTNLFNSDIKFLDGKTISNKNIINYKVLDLVRHYSFDIDLFSV
jgi:hypothetical protein